MRRVEAESVRRFVLGQARKELAKAAEGNNVTKAGKKILSKAEQKNLKDDLQEAANRARQIKGPGARISVNDVMNLAYAPSVTDAMNQVNVRGAKWFSIPETKAVQDEGLKTRIWQARGALIAPANLSNERLNAIATQFVIDNAEQGYSGGNIADEPFLFPSVNSGEMGLHAYMVSGGASVRLAEFAKAARPRSAANPALRDFDPAKQQIIATKSSFDEEEMYVSVIDKKTGDITHIGGLGMVDAIWMMGDETFARVLPNYREQFNVEEPGDVDHYDLIRALSRDVGTALDIGNNQADF